MFKGNLDEYRVTLDQYLADFISRASSNLDVSGWEDVVDWTRDELGEISDRYLAGLVQANVITKRQLDTLRKAKMAEAKRRATISAMVVGVEGEDSTTPRGFVAGRLRQLKLKLTWKGSIVVNRKPVTLDQLQRMVRLAANEAGFAASERGILDDATVQWFEDRLEEHRSALASAFDERMEFPWDEFVRNHFIETPECNYDLIAAVVQKFVHQVRRKLAGLPVEHHLMVVLHGIQGCGKTYLIERMLKPFADSVSWSDFEQLTDSRNIDLWRSPIIVLDEMAKATRADIETVKHVITATTLDRRPMRSNRTIQVLNEAVVIGASNHRIDEIIRDETGIRRFFELLVKSADDRDREFDFKAMWSSVQPDDADPLANMRANVEAAQSPYRVAGVVEDWLQTRRRELHDGTYTTEELYHSFRDHRANVTMGVDFQSRTMQAFSSELRRIIDARAELNIRKVRHASGIRWVFTGGTYLREVA